MSGDNPYSSMIPPISSSTFYPSKSQFTTNTDFLKKGHGTGFIVLIGLLLSLFIIFNGIAEGIATQIQNGTCISQNKQNFLYWTNSFNLIILFVLLIYTIMSMRWSSQASGSMFTPHIMFMWIFVLSIFSSVIMGYITTKAIDLAKNGCGLSDTQLNTLHASFIMNITGGGLLMLISIFITKESCGK